MSCNACTRRYGFFCKESGCPNCGYSFCTKCLKKTIEVPRRNGAKLNVCLKCYEKLEREKLMSDGKPDAGAINTAQLLAIESEVPLEVDLATPIEPIHLGDEAKPDEDNEIANNLDSVLSKRLKGLKEDDANEFPTDSDMASRLADLKGVPYKEYSKADLLLNKDTRTDKEKMEDLIKQFVEETDIDRQAQPSNPLQDIERRLAALKGDNSGKVDIKVSSENATGTYTPSDNDDDEEGATAKVLQRYLEEAKLPTPPTTEEQELIAGLPPPSKDTEELPWCTICNEDAVIRCLGCDGDLFCRNCHRECHDDEDFREHKSQPYSKPPTFKEDHF